jgi:hypothetical protein
MTGQRFTPPTTQSKVSNFQRNGNVQATLEEQIIEVAKKISFLKRSQALAEEAESLQPVNLGLQRISRSSLQEALKEYHALRQQFESAGHELSEKARQITEYAMAPADLKSRPPQVMLG